MARGQAALLAALAAALGASALRTAGSDGAQASRLDGQPAETQQGPIGDLLVPNRKYFFLSHRKTGTNLMWKLCDVTSRMAFGENRCGVCYRVMPPAEGSTHPRCFKPISGPEFEEAPLDGTFTMVTSIAGSEMMRLLEGFPDFRAVHMVREPTRIAISDYQYEKFIRSPGAPDHTWDTRFTGENFTDVVTGLRKIARQVHKDAEEIISTDSVVSGDRRVLKFDLDSIAGNYDDFSTRMYNHLFDGPPPSKLHLLVQEAASEDTSRWTQDQLHGSSASYSSHWSSRREALDAWDALRRAGDEDVLAVASDAERLGY